MEMLLVFAAIIGCGIWWAVSNLGGKKADVPTVVPVPKTAEEKALPNYEKFKALLALQDHLRASGADEKLVREICDKAAPLLLGESK